MSLVTVKPKFQVTIPAKLRKQIGLHEGDLMEATVVEDGILLRPKEVVDRIAAADRIASILMHTAYALARGRRPFRGRGDARHPRRYSRSPQRTP